ncbi:MAG: NEW3 domain-containing protein [Pyrinomonadaceae bacterium]
MRKHSAIVLALVLSGVPFLPVVQQSWAARAQVRATNDRGALGLGQLLRRLQTTASAMHTGAHPDDEDTALIARLARGEQARVAYLALNRGEGGQNVIGAELFEPLGVIRTEELLQSRRLDGGEQFFTRAFDYGFTKTRAEAAEKWGEGLVLGDMVRAIRIFRPLVVIARFTGTPADGHGHHQLSGHLTPQAFRAAADPAQFPEQLTEGLRPWQAKKLYVSEGFTENQNNVPTLRLNTGDYDDLLGRSYFEVAMEGRSQHKSQEMGMLELRGPQNSGVRLLENLVKTGETERGVFDGIDISITGIAKLTNVPGDVMGDELGDAQKAAARALATYELLAPQKIIAPLADGLRAVRKARAKLAAGKIEQNALADADFMLARKESDFSEALRRAAGVEIDALAEDETVAPGESLPVSVRVFVPANSAVKVGDVRLRVPAGWQAEATTDAEKPVRGPFRPARETAAKAAAFTLHVPENAPLTQPYWLSEAREGNVFKWPEGVPKNEPFSRPLVSGEATIEIDGAEVMLERPVQYRYADDVRGELRRALNVVPALSVGLDTDLLIAPSGSLPSTQRIAVRVTNHSQHAASGEVKLQLPAGWISQPSVSPFRLGKKGERTAAVFKVTIPRAMKTGAYKISASANVDSRFFTQEMRTIAYPHVSTHRLYVPAMATVRVFDLKVAPVRVGYIMGSGDQVPEAIRRMNLDVAMLDENELSSGDLSRFDTIVVGVRASQVRPDFAANNNRLLEFVKGGGTLIVQYQRPDYVAANLAPFPAKMASRTTDERAPVTILQPQHSAFNFPNKITAQDWDGWVQERSLYNFTTFDSQYVPLLESHDAGEEPQRGGEVYAEIGRGKFVYTSYSWFRQLPSGVPGAYRLFANLLSLPKTNRSSALSKRAAR